MILSAIRLPHKVFADKAEAEALLRILLADGEDAANYRLVEDPLGTGKVIVEVLDDDGTKLFNL